MAPQPGHWAVISVGEKSWDLRLPKSECSGVVPEAKDQTYRVKLMTSGAIVEGHV